MTFLNNAELENAISRGLLVAVEYTVNQVKNENESSINEEVYGAYSPSWYERTQDFLNAWETQTSGGGSHVEGEMYYEPGDIGIGDVENGQHVSIITGSSQAESMPAILYQGGMGCVPRPTHRDAWKNLDRKLTNTEIRSIFEAGLSASGMPWKRKTGSITVTKTR